MEPTVSEALACETFTAEDRRMLQEVHSAITEIANTITALMPSLGKSPIGRMLGL